MGLSTKPYLIRAIHEWCTDSGYRPYIAVSVDEHTIVPREFVRGGEIVLNVSPAATNRLRIGNDLIEFEARFGGVARAVSIPIDNVSAIYAQETGQGMAFEVPKPLALAPEPEGAPGAPASGPVLVEAPVPRAEASQEGSPAGPAPVRRRPRLAAVPAPETASPEEPVAPGDEPQDAEAPKPSKRRRKAPAGKAEAAAAAAGTEPPVAPASGRAGKGARGAKADKDEPASTQQGGSDDESPTPPPKGPPRLTRVK
ncbi:ClpXP protease specificity-enhancing factor [Zeimonas arvi]|uniref:ClpXP protease specificity-enhancing factor n=1 Tax=Zeimonas arvi TaxID=2498847 RepID=A0A5C8NWI5_9BURK|nr:ClpXP protease specificity-enhancing factor [Zeimonas arvi]